MTFKTDCLSPEILAIIPLNGPNWLYITGHFDSKFVLVYKHLFVLIPNEKETKTQLSGDIKIIGPCRTWFGFIWTFSYLIFIGATFFFFFFYFQLSGSGSFFHSSCNTAWIKSLCFILAFSRGLESLFSWIYILITSHRLKVVPTM